jgi:hypothetical protein
MDEARMFGCEFRAVSYTAFLAPGSVTRLHCALKVAMEPAALPNVLARDARVQRKLDGVDEFDLEALGLTQAVGGLNFSEGAQRCGDQRR